MLFHLLHRPLAPLQTPGWIIYFWNKKEALHCLAALMNGHGIGYHNDQPLPLKRLVKEMQG
jgi:hypothetical protein